MQVAVQDRRRVHVVRRVVVHHPQVGLEFRALSRVKKRRKDAKVASRIRAGLRDPSRLEGDRLVVVVMKRRQESPLLCDACLAALGSPGLSVGYKCDPTIFLYPTKSSVT